MQSITNFWHYFQQNHFVFLLFKEIPEAKIKKQFDLLLQKLHLYHRDLGLIISYQDSTNAELIVTANGNPYLFKEVQLLVYHAPVVKHWKITAFLQPQTNLVPFLEGTDQPFSYFGVTLHISKMYFLPLVCSEWPKELGIQVLLNNYYVQQNHPRLQEAVYTVLEHLVGEKSFANELYFIDIAQLQQHHQDAIELYQLKLYVDLFYGSSWVLHN